MPVELVRATPDHLPVLTPIFFEAFKTLSDRHGFPTDIPTLEIAEMGMTSFLNRPDMYGVAAIEDGKVVGHNFLQLSDAVAGVGPICVSSGVQSKGTGRMLMRHVIDHALARHGPMVRLVQEAINMTSLSLYASLGFVVREPLVLVTFEPTGADDPHVRALTPADVEACDALYRGMGHVSRKNELLGMIHAGPSFGCTPHGRFVGGRVTAFAIPGFFGFGAAESAEELLTLAQAAARNLPAPMHRFLLPTRQAELFAGALRRGFRSVKALHLMSMGPYEEPKGTWYPSIAF